MSELNLKPISVCVGNWGMISHRHSMIMDGGRYCMTDRQSSEHGGRIRRGR